MSAQPCGCDPEAKWKCSAYPACTYGRWEAQNDIRQELSGKLAGVDAHQPAPRANERPAVQDLAIEDLRAMERSLARDPHIDDRAFGRVVADVEARKQIGLERYGTLLQAFNGRDALMDAYQESLDLVVYLRQVKEEGQVCVDVSYWRAQLAALHLRTLIEERDANPAGLTAPVSGD